MKLLCLRCLGIMTCPKGSCTDLKPTSPVERWALKNSKHTSAEEIITATLVQSFAKDLDKWISKDFGDPEKAWDNRSGTLTYNHEKRNIVIQRKPERKHNPRGLDKYRFNGLYVNGEEMPSHLAKMIVDAWTKIAARVIAAQQAAETAKTNMEKNERAWNLAEDLLGLKRNEFGALVPKETVE